MGLPQGLDFRATSGYVTDPTNCTFEIGAAVNYPRTTPQGISVGWTVVGPGLTTRDRSLTNDPRLAGIAATGANGIITYRIDLPSAGTYNFRIALGDPSYSRSVKCELFDNTTSLGVMASGSTGAANSFRDAGNTVRTAAAWPGSNTLLTNKTFATTTCFFKLGTGTTTDQYVAHLYVESSGVVAQGLFAMANLCVGAGGPFFVNPLQ